MNRGVLRVVWAEDESRGPAVEIEPAVMPEQEDVPRRRWPAIVAGAILAVLALAWVGVLAILLADAAVSRPLPPLTVAAWIGVGVGPLILLALLYLILLRTGRAEANSYSRASARLREDTARLSDTLSLLARRIDAARGEIGEQAKSLDTLGTTAGERIARSAADLRTQAQSIGQSMTTFTDAAGVARADLGVLLAELPGAEAVARALAERLREGGAEADTRTRGLNELLATLDAHARAANESTAGAAARLGGQIDRIEASAAAADKRIEETALSMGRAIDAALETVAEGLEDSRHVMAQQSQALTAMVEQSRASVGIAGDDATRALSARLDELIARVEGIGAGLRGQELAARGLLTQLDAAIVEVEARFAELGGKGAEHTADLAEHVVALSSHADAIGRALGGSSQAAESLLSRVDQVRQMAEASSLTLSDTLPAALARIRLHAEQSLQSIGAAGSNADRLGAVASDIGDRLSRADALLERQRAALDAIGASADERIATLSDRTRQLEELLARTRTELEGLGEGASGRLTEALGAVRDVAAQAADQARDALSAAIPRAAQRMSESAARAMSAALGDVGQEQIAAVGTASEQAVQVVRAATERLTAQLVSIAETSTAIEARIEANRADTESHDEQNFGRTTGLLIEALNSTAIDVTKIFSNEVSDEDWRAYLRGDRGIFTRRAVRLIDRADAGAIVQRYNSDGEFREQVSRYIHDFESLLRRVMGAREGTAIATTILSSDTGKLYVALAQAIDRLRR